jgi:hypothetical protein
LIVLTHNQSALKGRFFCELTNSNADKALCKKAKKAPLGAKSIIHLKEECS